jgi:hypothetical protein
MDHQFSGLYDSGPDGVRNRAGTIFPEPELMITQALRARKGIRTHQECPGGAYFVYKTLKRAQNKAFWEKST